MRYTPHKAIADQAVGDTRHNRVRADKHGIDLPGPDPLLQLVVCNLARLPAAEQHIDADEDRESKEEIEDREARAAVLEDGWPLPPIGRSPVASAPVPRALSARSEEHTSELQSREN